MSLPNLRQTLGENFWIVSGYEDYASDSDDGSENILEKSCGEDVSDMSDEDFPVTRKKRFTGKKGVELRKNQLKVNQAGKGKIHLENIFPLRTYRDWGANAKTVKWFSKHVVKKSNTLINRCHFFHYKKNSNIYPNTESVKKTFVKISHRMFSEIMPALTEMFIMKTKNSEKRALLSSKCSRGALSIVDKIENWKNTRKKNYFRRWEGERWSETSCCPSTEY